MDSKSPKPLTRTEKVVKFCSLASIIPKKRNDFNDELYTAIEKAINVYDDYGYDSIDDVITEAFKILIQIHSNRAELLPEKFKPFQMDPSTYSDSDSSEDW